VNDNLINGMNGANYDMYYGRFKKNRSRNSRSKNNGWFNLYLSI